MKRLALECRGLVKTYGSSRALEDFDLDVREHEFLVLLGPSGSGKTTLLRVIAGLEQPSLGSVSVMGEEVSDLRRFPPERRGIGLVFQDYALFPHMSVFDNIAFGLSGRNGSKRARVGELLALVGLTGFEKRYPHELSGGEQQRVALARTLAPSPRLVLLDEPFSNLDADLRRSMRHEIKRILKEIRTTAILVTHDQEEAFEIGDRIAVMSRGRVEQIGTPEEIYHHPATRFVAEFIGRSDFLDGCWCELGVETELGILPPGNNSGQADSGQAKCGRLCEVLIRPDMVEIEPDERGQAVIVDQRFSGMKKLYCLELGSGRRIHSLQSSTAAFELGSRVRVKVNRAHCVCFSKET